MLQELKKRNWIFIFDSKNQIRIWRRKSCLWKKRYIIRGVPFRERLIITRLSLDEGVKFEATIVLGRDSNSVTQSLSSKSIWRRGWSRISLPIHRVTVSLFTLSLSLFLSLGSFLLFDEARWRSVVEFSPSINAANPRLIRDRSWNRPTLSTLAISSRFSKNLITLLVSLKIRCSNLK